MQAEIEVKFTDIEIDDMRKRLEKAGAHLEQPMRLMRRVNIEQPHHQEAGAWIRIRDEGDKVTMTYKAGMKKQHAIDRLQELEVTVSDFDTTVEIFKAAGWPPKTYQESKRETWKLGDGEIVIDEWPWLAPMVEIEAKDADAVRALAEALSFNWNDAEYGNIDDVYMHHYNFIKDFRGVIDLETVRFGDPVPQEFGERK